MVLQHRDHLSLLLARRGLEEARLIASGVINVGAGQRKVLQHEHARFVSEAIEVPRQNVGHDAQRIDVRLFRHRDIRRESFGIQLVEPVGRRVARAAQEHGTAVDAKTPATRADIGRERAEREGFLDTRGLDAVARARDELGAVHRLRAEAPRFPFLRAGERKTHRHCLLCSAAQVHLTSQPQRITT